VKCNVQLGYFFLFLLFLPSSGEHIFGSIAAFFALDDVFQRGRFPRGVTTFIFHIFPSIALKPQTLGPFSDLKNYD